MRPIFFSISFLASVTFAFALASVTQVAWPGKPVGEREGWPEGVVKFVNDPVRTEGWNPWFSELPNDVERFYFKLRDFEDANRLLKKLAAIQATNVQVQLNPGREAPDIGFGTRAKNATRHAAVFVVGNQKVLDEWFERLPRNEKGLREFGKGTYSEPPKAMAPTLTFYVGSPSIDLSQLEIPARVRLSADVSDDIRKANPGDPTVKAIDDFVARHRNVQNVK